eukprot:TRINITY_DN54805_c0_g1_i1.p1 TRINITY_DN54805_c0_g1~~TRINITY_DN54805_c0_g1_i1.p1  ORF type:complete len:1251 (+),score=196.49 TRINITY_DN54805_c0_g1_i1:44-3754(+)
MQRDIHAKVVDLLQKATVEREIADRIRLLQQSQEILLHADTLPETVSLSLDFFLNLQADPHTALRRFAAHFLERLLILKPFLALRCVPVVAALLKDEDGVVQELAVRCACPLHGRALHLLALEDDQVQFQRYWEALQQVRGVIVDLLARGCPSRPALFRQVARWVRLAVLVQTPSPLMLRVRVPLELRGANCLQDFPTRPGLRLDLEALRRQAEETFQQICQLLQEPPQGRWSRPHIASLIRCVGSIGRQRPTVLRTVLDIWKCFLQDSSAVLGGQTPQGAMPVPPADAGYLRQVIWDEVQRLLASNVASDWHGEITEMLHNVGGVSGRMEDLAAQAKYQQICTLWEKRAGAATNGEPAFKRARLNHQRRAWADGDVNVDASGASFGAEDAFDADALLSGEAEYACRRFEDYFGLPSQREPAGHVPGPALLASRIPNNAELARLALTSLNSLAEKRFLLRDRAHERAVLAPEPMLRKASCTTASVTSDGKELALFLSAKPEESGREEDTASRNDPRCALLSQSERKAMTKHDENSPHGESLLLLEPIDGGGPLTKLPGIAGRDSLQLLIFEEILEARERMAISPLRASLSEPQLDAFERLSRQVALHLAAGVRLAVGPGLQRAMCRAFMSRSLDSLRKSLDTKNTDTATLALGQLAELFYAKFSVDLARCQDSLGLGNQSASSALAKTPFNDVLEGSRPGVSGVRLGTFTYAELFEMFICEFDRRELPRRELRGLLSEIPLVPSSAFRMLEDQCRCQEERPRKVALMTLLALLEARPSCRWQGIFLLFKLAYGAGDDSVVRFDTIRLIINKIYSAGLQKPMRWQLPHLDDAEAAPLLEGGSIEAAAAAAAASAQANDDVIPLSKLRCRCVEDVATIMLRSMAPPMARFSFGVDVSKRIEQLRAALFESKVTRAGIKTDVCAPKDRIWLYLALCIKRPALLHGLVETFTQCDDAMKDHLVSSVEEAIKHIPASEPELLTLVQKATPETERLVLKVLHILMQSSQGKEGLTKAYGEAVTRLYGITQNPRLLVPVFDLLDRRHLLDFLPAVLQLESQQVTDAFGQLVRSKAPPLSVTELLTELHHMNKPNENIVPLKCSMQALNIIFSMREMFDTKVYGIVIQSLVEEQGPLPTLFMRTVIQVVKELPKLSDFIVKEILPRLVRQEVWSDENMWRGFKFVLQHTFASQPGPAARVLTILPHSHLEDVLVQHPDWKAQLVEFVARQPHGSIPPHVRHLLQ